ncbi:hypothetical protein KBD81_01320 [Candidatus Woesebacteria bacterium]|nr:hypothetical protein [Candidatus Woesebacteria bacterium]
MSKISTHILQNNILRAIVINLLIIFSTVLGGWLLLLFSSSWYQDFFPALFVFSPIVILLVYVLQLYALYQVFARRTHSIKEILSVTFGTLVIILIIIIAFALPGYLKYVECQQEIRMLLGAASTHCYLVAENSRALIMYPLIMMYFTYVVGAATVESMFPHFAKRYTWLASWKYVVRFLLVVGPILFYGYYALVYPLIRPTPVIHQMPPVNLKGTFEGSVEIAPSQDFPTYELQISPQVYDEPININLEQDR